MNFIKNPFVAFVLLLIFISIPLPGHGEKMVLDWDVINITKKQDFITEKNLTSSISESSLLSLKDMQETPASEQDSLILVNFFNNSFGVFWTVKWDFTQPMDTWIGVTLNEERRVIGLELNNNRINGSIPSSFGQLSELKTLIIEDDSNFDSFIPKEIGNLSKLEVLRIHNTEVSGPLPFTIGQLTSLQQLDLSDNLMYGTIPEGIGNLNQLTELRLDNNQFTGDLPESLGNLTGLQVMDISENRLTRVLDMTASSPSTFNVQRNKLTFESLLPNLGILDTFVPQDSVGVAHSINLITGESFILDLRIDEEVPDNVYTWFKDGVEILQTNEHTFTFDNVTDADEGVYTFTVTNPGLPSLTLIGRHVTINVANSCTERDSLAVLDVLYALGTPIARDFGNIHFHIEEDPLDQWPWITLNENRCVETFAISLDNDFYFDPRTDGMAYISPAIGDLANLRRLQIISFSNEEAESIHGILPPEMGKLVNLDTLRIWANYLSGEIPEEFSNLTNLQNLNLTCGLTGNLPAFIGTFTDLTNLELYGNQLSGEIPLSFQNLSLLEWFTLGGNQLTGNIPEIFGSMGNLRGINLAVNQLTGTLPEQLWDLTTLTNLYLSYNQLTGTISEDVGNLTELFSLGFGNNQFEGAIPASISNLTKLRNLYLNDNQLTGPIPEGIGNLIDMNYFYLNNNQLSGPLPESFGNFDESLLYVHLENNQLSGEFPEGIENWTGVFELYAHNNQISGEIPAGIGNMERLRLLSLYDNQLNGTIPRELGNLEELFWIGLGNNQLSGAVPRELGKMNRLGRLHLQNNQLTSIENGFTTEDPEASFHISNFRIENNLLADLPDLTGMEFMKNDTTSVFGNQLTFEDILPNMGLSENFFGSRFYYAPQDSIGEALEVKLNQGDDYTIDLSIDEAIEDNVYQWLKDGSEHETTNVNELVLENLTAEDAGVYTTEVTNPGVPNLTLFSRAVTIIINAPPVFTSTPLTEATVGTEYVYDITASDPDGDALTIMATTLPAWVELTDNGDGTATLQGTPQAGDCADNQVTLLVEDVDGLSSEQSFEISITLALTVSVEADPSAICAGETVTFTATLNETVENSVFTWVVNEEVVEGETGSTFTSSTLADGDVVNVKVSAESAACINSDEIESNPVSISVGENFTMSVDIQTDRTSVCQGEEVTFTAELTDAGPNPQFVWKINDNTVEENASAFTTDALNDGDVVSVEVTTDEAICITNTTASAEVAMRVTESLSLAVSLTSDKTVITSGETIIFTASTDYTGSALQYEWFINNQLVNGEASTTFTTSTLQNNDKVKVKMIAEPVECLEQTEAESEEITIIVNDPPAFTSTPVMAATVGIDYSYDITAADPDEDALTITASTLPAWVELTDNGNGTATLQGTPQVTDCADNQVTLMVEDVNGLSSEQSFEIIIAFDLSVSMEADRTTVCTGEIVIFTATLSETVENPVFMWLVNDELVEEEATGSFTTSALADGDVVTVQVNTEAIACMVPDPVVSAPVNINVGDNLTMSASIHTVRTSICEGEEVTFTAELTHAGPNPQFDWKLNDTAVGENTPTFATDALSDGDVVSVEVTTDASACITNTTANAAVTMNVTENIALAVTLSSDKTEISAGETVTFTANTDFTSSAVQYQWFINDQVVNGESRATFESDFLQNNDRVKVRINVEPILCLENTEAESEEIIIIVNENNEIFVQDIDKTLDEDTGVTFASSDFSSAFSAGSNLVAVRITALPTKGTLTLSGNIVAVNQEVEVDQLGSLDYTPEADVNGEDVFGWNGSNGTSFGENDAHVNITINPVNDPPVFTLSGNVSVPENFSTVETVIITPGFVPVDESNQNVTYQLVPPSVSFVNIVFDPQSGMVSITSVPDQTGRQEFEIIANDGQLENNTHFETFVLEVQPDNAFPPNNIAVDNLSVQENQPVGTLVGTISVTDDDPDDRHVLTLAGNGPDNAFFLIDGNQLKTNAVLDFETQSAFQISIRTTDLGGNFLEEQFTVAVTDVNDFPTDLMLSANEVRENDPVGTQVGEFTSEDQDAGEDLTFTLVDGVADNVLFSISENVLLTNVTFDFEEKASYEIRVRVADGKGGFIEEMITIAVIDVEPEEIEIISGFTPDFDRMNDTWDIPGLGSYPKCTVEVFNSWGQRIFFSNGYLKPWDGTYQNNDVPVGTYYYIIDLNNGQPPVTGDIVVMR